MTREIEILKGHVSRDHVHLPVSCPPKPSVSDVHGPVRQGREQPRAVAGVPGVARACGCFCTSSGTVTDAMVKAYIERQGVPPDDALHGSRREASAGFEPHGAGL